MKCTQRDYFTSMGNYSYLPAMVWEGKFGYKTCFVQFPHSIFCSIVADKGFQRFLWREYLPKAQPLLSGCLSPKHIFQQKRGRLSKSQTQISYLRACLRQNWFGGQTLSHTTLTKWGYALTAGVRVDLLEITIPLSSIVYNTLGNIPTHLQRVWNHSFY